LTTRGIILRLASQLRHHYWGGLPLSRWLGFLLLAGALASLVYWWPVFWPAILLAVCWLTYSTVLTWAARQGFVCFKAAARSSDLLEGAPTDAALYPEEMIPVRASGSFAVEGRTRYYVDIEADFETVGTREHIVLARVYASRFLVLGRWPGDELGWWYIFFEPAMIQELSLGHLCFGPQPQMALRVIYAVEKGTQETFYLVVDDPVALRRVWDNLRLDAPPGATG